MSSGSVHTNRLLMTVHQASPSRPQVRWAFEGRLEWLQAPTGSAAFGAATLRSQLVSFMNAAGWRDTEVVSASMRKDYMMTLVRACPPSNALQAFRCCVMPQ